MVGSTPLVSVVIPTRNRSAWLRETLRSVQAQTWQAWEALVVDDASSDDTRDALKSMAALDARIRLMVREGECGGAQVCRNQGVAAARGEYVLFMDSDDLLEPWCLSQRVNALESERTLDFVVGGTGFFSRVPGDLGVMLNGETREDDLERFLRFDCPWQTMSPLWRRVGVARVGAWDERLIVGQDMDFHGRALGLGMKYCRIAGIDCHYRSHADGRETIGRQTRTARWYESQAQRIETIHQLLKVRGTLSGERLELVKGNYLHWAVEAAQGGHGQMAQQIWSRAAALGVMQQRNLWWQLFRAFCRTWAAPLAYSALVRSWPQEGFIFTRCTLAQWPVEGRPVERIITICHPQHPLQHLAGPLREGALRYVVRRLHPVRFWKVLARDMGWSRKSPAQARLVEA